MSNTIFITANWTTGALSQQTISRQYDNNRYAVQFIGYPEGDGTEELDLYLLVWMSTAPGQKPGEITPIQLNSDQWYISNYFTQQVQVIKFQLCVLNEAGTYEAHSPIFSGRIGDSLEHDGTSHDIDVSTLFDAYREYLNELIIGAGAVIIDPTPTQGSSNAVSSGGVWSALQNIDVSTDTTLSVSGKPADAKAVGDELFTDTSTETPATPEGTSANYKLTGDGNCVSNSSYNIYRYVVTAGDMLKIISNDYFQFQNGSGVPTSGNNKVVGEVYGAGTYNVTVPETATYLYTSVLKTDATSNVYYVTSGEKISKIRALTDRLDAIDTATAEDVGKALKAKTVTDGKVTDWEFGDTGTTVVTDTTLTESGVPADAKATGDAVHALEYPWGTAEESIDPALTVGEYYNANNGTIGTYSGDAFRRTDLIDVTGWASAKVSCVGWDKYAGVCFYDAEQTFISSTFADNVAHSDDAVTIPPNAKYIGVSSYKTVPITLTAIKNVSYAEIKDTIDTLTNGMLEKNIVLFGDSVTDVNVNGKWVKEIQKIMDFKSLTNYARGYCQWCFTADTVYDITNTGNTGDANNVIWNQYNRLVADVSNDVIDIPDAVFIFAGVNDAIFNKTIGTVADAMAIADIRSAQVSTLTNVCASIRRVIEDIYATFPYTKIFIVTPLQNGTSIYETRLHSIVPCMRDLCANYAIDVIDLNKNSGITYYVEKDSHVFLADGTHPTDAGGKHIANYIKSWIFANYGYDETITKTFVPQT